jgi:hypothetical protein
MGFFSKIFKKLAISKIYNDLSGKTAARMNARAMAENQERARQDALKAQMQARKAEVFAQTEGAGQGKFGKVRNGISDEIDPDDPTVSKRARGSLRI